MITNFKAFEELRTDRISIENRKFDALANLSSKYILVANAKGELLYMNNGMYSLLKLESDDVLRKSILESPIPDSVKEAYDLAIKRRSKIENAEIVVYPRVYDENDQSEIKPEFSGYANVIPIRGKQSLLDYYLMVVSKDVFE
jgi:PAS domain-containing protein